MPVINPDTPPPVSSACSHSFSVDAWHCSAPGLETVDDWRRWLANPGAATADTKAPALKQIPPILRRRFNTLGKHAAHACLSVLTDGESIPSIFASRHGDTDLTLSLLEDIGRGEPLSPTSFSLAVHNAVSGLLSIAREDRGQVTAIAANDSLLLQALFESISQLQHAQRVLCVIYDAPLPALYQPYCRSDAFPYALALILSTQGRRTLTLARSDNRAEATIPVNPEPLEALKLLTGDSSEIRFSSHHSTWTLCE